MSSISVVTTEISCSDFCFVWVRGLRSNQVLINNNKELSICLWVHGGKDIILCFTTTDDFVPIVSIVWNEFQSKTFRE